MVGKRKKKGYLKFGCPLGASWSLAWDVYGLGSTLGKNEFENLYFFKKTIIKGAVEFLKYCKSCEKKQNKIGWIFSVHRKNRLINFFGARFAIFKWTQHELVWIELNVSVDK